MPWFALFNLWHIKTWRICVGHLITKTLYKWPKGTFPFQRSRAKKLQQEVHALLYEFQLNTNENFILPKSCMLILLRFTKEEGQNISRANQQEKLCPSESSTTEPSRRNSHIFWFPKVMKAHKYFLESSWSLVSNASKDDLIKSTRKAADLL
jgi:hypothetical protein